MNKEYWKAILMRAWHAVWETAAATLPTTIVITPAMIKEFDASTFIVVLAWLLTALAAGVFSIIKSLAAGIPEAQLTGPLNEDDEDDEDEDSIDEEGDTDD